MRLIDHQPKRDPHSWVTSREVSKANRIPSKASKFNGRLASRIYCLAAESNRLMSLSVMLGILNNLFLVLMADGANIGFKD